MMRHHTFRPHPKNHYRQAGRRIMGCMTCGKLEAHAIHKAKKPISRRRQARHPGASTPEPLHQTSEEALETELHSLIANARTYLATADYPGLLSVHHVATLEEAGHETIPQDRGLMLTLHDGSVYKLSVLRERGPEIEFPDQSV